MKPDKAKELAIPSDLSITAFSEAVDMIKSPFEYNGYYRLSVASQELSTATMFAAMMGGKHHMEVHISTDYEPDEWSLAFNYWEDGDMLTEIVWSPGA